MNVQLVIDQVKHVYVGKIRLRRNIELMIYHDIGKLYNLSVFHGEKEIIKMSYRLLSFETLEEVIKRYQNIVAYSYSIDEKELNVILTKFE